jgi:hypothetical protein
VYFHPWELYDARFDVTVMRWKFDANSPRKNPAFAGASLVGEPGWRLSVMFGDLSGCKQGEDNRWPICPESGGIGRI